jgi:general stress protein 26
MSDTATLSEIKAFAARLSPWAHLASIGADNKPDVVPVHPCWEGDVAWVMIGAMSVKARNISNNPNIAMHWQVTEVGDGVELWGTAEIFTDLATKRRLWEGVFDYDLNLFAPGGPEDSPDVGFLAITLERALVVKQYGAGGMLRWSAA